MNLFFKRLVSQKKKCNNETKFTFNTFQNLSRPRPIRDIAAAQKFLIVRTHPLRRDRQDHRILRFKVFFVDFWLLELERERGVEFFKVLLISVEIEVLKPIRRRRRRRRCASAGLLLGCKLKNELRETEEKSFEERKMCVHTKDQIVRCRYLSID